MDTSSTDTLQIQIEPAREGYQVSLFQQGVPLLGGPSRPETLVSLAEVRPIRREYEQQIQLFHDLEIAGMPAAPPDPQALLALGRRIAKLLPPLARQGLVEAVQRAQRERRRLQVLLEVAPTARELLGVPWELMVLPLTRGAQADDGGEGFLLLNAEITLIRQVRGVGRNTAPTLTLPVTLQALVAAPADGQLIDTRETRAALARVLSPDGLEHVWYEGAATLTALHERLRAHRPQILHLLCHGEESTTTYGTRHDLLFTHQDGFTQRVSAFDLAPALTLAPEIQLVVLQVCHSGATPRSAPASGAPAAEEERRTVESIALALVRQGIPLVVAMQGEVGQAAAGAFVQTLYAELAREVAVDQAVAAGRIAMQAAGGVVDWSLPVIYQGSGQAETATWYTRLADRLEAALRDPGAVRATRGSLIAWGILLITVAVVRWLLTPVPLELDLPALVSPLAVWVAVGLLGPALIAAGQRGAGGRDDLSAQVRRDARRAQWMGAYLGYGLASLAGMAGLVSLWAVGMLALLPPVVTLLLFGGVLLATLFASYTISRSQWRSALAIAPVDATIYTAGAVALMIGAMLLLVAVPWLVFTLPGSPFSALLFPAPAALALGLAVISLLLLGGG